MQGKLLSGGAFKDKSCRKDVFSESACKEFKDKLCREDVFSGGACKEESCTGGCKPRRLQG